MPHTKTSAIAAVLAEEAVLRDERTFRTFREGAIHCRNGVRRFAHGHRPLYAYGAAAKGNTLLNWCGITHEDILAIGDTTPAKQGKFLPGSRIPIVSEGELIARAPPLVLILPWNWRAEIVGKLGPRLPHTEFVTPLELA
jgi:hypothetical protein